MIPKTYQQWYQCITKECGIPITKEFILQRLAILEDHKNEETRRFISLYGQHHLDNIIQWFKKAREQ